MKLYELKKYLEDKSVIFSFTGTISQVVLTGLGDVIEKELQTNDTKTKIIQNIFAIFTEQMQNIMSYSKDKKEKSCNMFESHGVCIIGYDLSKNKYYVSSANFMDKNDEEAVTNKINKINSLDKTELKQYYRELRKSGKDAHNRGAGLGFLEMAKKSNDPLEFTITKMDRDRLFFEIKVYVDIWLY